MLSYELGYWWADHIVKLHQSFSHRVGQQVFISELTQNFYFLCHWRAVGGGGNEAPKGWFKVGGDFVVALHGDGSDGILDVGDGADIASPVDKPVAFLRLSYQIDLCPIGVCESPFARGGYITSSGAGDGEGNWLFGKPVIV